MTPKERMEFWLARAQSDYKVYDEESKTATAGRKAVLDVWKQKAICDIADIKLGLTEIEMGKEHSFKSNHLREARTNMPEWGTRGT